MQKIHNMLCGRAVVPFDEIEDVTVSVVNSGIGHAAKLGEIATLVVGMNIQICQ